MRMLYDKCIVDREEMSRDTRDELSRRTLSFFTLRSVRI